MSENDRELAELLLLPGVGTAKARALFNAGYKTAADIAGADPLELAKVPGIGISMAKEMVNYSRVMGSAGESQLPKCPLCGGSISEGTCSDCGLALSSWTGKDGEDKDITDKDGDGFWYSQEEKKLFICPECGSLVADGSPKCHNCGVQFDDEEEEDGEIILHEPGEKDGYWYRDQKQIFMCPNCGSFISSDADRCSACGIVFEDDGEEEEPTEPEGLECPMCGKLLEHGQDKCPDCGFDFTAGKEQDKDGFWYKERDGLFMCPNCGMFLPSSASQCSTCGVVFEEEDDQEPEAPAIRECPMCGKALTGEEFECSECGFDFTAQPDGFWMKEQKGLSMCPNCGSLISADAESCPNCRVLFDGEEEDVEPVEETEPTDKKHDDGFWYREQKGLSMCPNCGSFISSDAEVCNACGIAFDDEEEELEPAPDYVTCPMCHALIPSDAGSCDECGFSFEEEREHDGFWYKKSGSLFICPNCGAFLSEASDSCHNCGLVFEEEEVAQEADSLVDSVELEEELDSIIEEEPAAEEEIPKENEDGEEDLESIYLCPICGAFIEANLTKCPSCDSVFDDIEDMELEPVSALSQRIASPEELSKEIAKDLEEIEQEMLEPPEESEEQGRGVSRDFLDRWKKLEPEKQDKRSIISDFKKRWESSQTIEQDMEDDLGLELEEPEAIEELEQELELVADLEQEDEEYWASRAEDMAAAGDTDEAIACLDKAADLNPDREMEYKRQMLELMGIGPVEQGIDISEIAEIDDIGELEIDQEEIALARLEEIESQLENDPHNAGLWQEKGEVLEQLERHQEAIECFDKSISYSYSGLKKDVKSDLRLPQINIGLTNGQGRINGSVNGLLTQRGLSNGLGKTNGLTNGRGQVNGLTKGKTNGLINGGLINGLVKGRTNGLEGKTNGLTNGLTNGRTNGLINGGLVNGLGLVNGEGMVDGAGSLRRLRHRQRERVLWRYRLSAMVMFVTIVLMISMLNNLMVQEESGALSIDGNFADWNDIPSYFDSPVDQVMDPDINLLESKILVERDRINLYARVEGIMLQGMGSNGTQEYVDSLIGFVDIDNDPTTGYEVQGLGADMAVDIYGWDNNAASARTLVFDDAFPQHDWNGYTVRGTSPVAMDQSNLETRIQLTRSAEPVGENARALIMIVSSQGYSDQADYLMSNIPGALDIVSISQGADSLPVAATDITLLHMTARSRVSRAVITELNLQMDGSAVPGDLGNYRIFNDTDNGGGLSSGDLEVPGEFAILGSNISFTPDADFIVPVNDTLDLWLVADIMDSAADSAFGLRLDNVSAPGTLAFCRDSNYLLHHVGPTQGIEIDGSFSDWAGIGTNVDASDDMIFQSSNISLINRNGDLADFRALSNGNLYAYLSVRGNILGGSEMPIYRTRPSSPTEPVNISLDTDRDSVPDAIDPMPFDFDNDGQNNSAENNDWDSDGVAEYPRGGEDYWMNTTIPSDFPQQWANRTISLYVGPIGHRELRGYDSAYILIDSDNNPFTGVNRYGSLGIDYAIVVQGKEGRIENSGLYRFSNAGEPWEWVGDVDSANDWYRLEVGVGFNLMNISEGQEFRLYAAMEDWKGSYDVSDSHIDLVGYNVPAQGTRAPKPRLDIDKVGPDTASPGETITYTITITNPSGAIAYDVSVVENYPPGTTFSSATPAPTTGDNEWYIGTMNPGDTYTITVSITLDTTLADGDRLRNTADVIYSDGSGKWSSKSTKYDTTVVVIPEMQNLALPIGGMLLVIIIFNNRKRNLKRKNGRLRAWNRSSRRLR